MALNKTRLQTAIRANVIANMDLVWPTAGFEPEAKALADQQRSDLANSIAKGVADAVIDEFQNNAEIATSLTSTDTTVASVGGVVQGADASGTGTGSLTNGGATGGIL